MKKKGFIGLCLAVGMLFALPACGETSRTDENQNQQQQQEQKPEEQKPEEQKPEEQKPEEQKLEEQKPEEQKPEEQKPEEQKPEEQKPEEQKPEEQIPPQNCDEDAPVFLGMKLFVSYSSQEKECAPGTDYHASENASVSIYLTIQNPGGYEFLPFTLGSETYEWKDLQMPVPDNYMLSIHVDEFDGYIEYALGDLKYKKDGEIKNFRMEGERIARLYREYKINYHGGKPSASCYVCYTSGSDPIDLEKMTLKGYKLLGCYTDEALTQKIETIETGSTGDIDLYLDWEPVTYKITYVLNGAVNGNNPDHYTVEDFPEKLAPATKDFLSFSGWYRDEKMNWKVSSLRGFAEDLTLYACFSDVEELNGIKFIKREEGYVVTGFKEGMDSYEIPKTFQGVNVVGIGNQAFLLCRAQKITIPEGVTFIEKEAFAFSMVPELKLPDSITRIDSAAFQTSQFKRVVLPAGIKKIEEATFKQSALESIEIPAGVTEIGEYAFMCDQLKSVTFLGNAVEKIGEDAFRSDLERTVKINDLEAWCKIEFANENSNPLYNFLFYNSKLIVGETQIQELTIPQGVKEIKPFAFAGLKIDGVNLNNVTEIGKSAFEKSKLTYVTFGEKLQKIGDSCFASCSNLDHFEIPASLKEIGREVFANVHLTEIHYAGTKDEWGKIKLDNDWKTYSDIKKVICSDGSEIKV